MEERKRKEEEERAHDILRKQAVALEQIRRSEKIKSIEDQYTLCAEASHSNTDGPLLLDAVVLPIRERDPKPPADAHAALCNEEIRVARSEINQALRLAHCYRDLAEKARSEKQQVQHKLETEIELVRDFWRNKVVEGGSRGGKLLRAALVRK